MKYQIFLFTTLIITLSVGLFSFTQIWRYMGSANIVFGSWGDDTAYINFEDTGSPSGSQILGESTQLKLVNTDQKVRVHKVSTKSFQGFLFDKYFLENNSPLYGYGEDFVNACRKYGATSDCTLLPAIAKIETNLCKTGISAKQYNCWGWGGSGSNRIVFNNFSEAIDTITQRLMVGYGLRFFQDTNNGALSYCGAHCTSYGNHVNNEKSNINNFFKNNGHPGLF